MEPTLRQALTLHQQGKLAQAEAVYRQLLAQQPDHFDALHMAGVVAAQSGHLDEAVRLISRAVQVRPGDAIAHDNLANALRSLGDFDGALREHERAIEADPALPEPHANRGTTLHLQGRHAQALESFDSAIRLRPDYAEAFNNRGNALSALGDPDGALGSYREAIRLQPDYAEAYFNLGAAIATRSRDAKTQAEAIRCYDEAIRLRPDYAEALANRALTLTELKDYAAALPSYDKALEQRPGYEFLRGMRLHTRMHLAQWEGFEQEVAALSEAVMRGEKVSPPFAFLPLVDSPELHRQVGATMLAAKYPVPAGVLPIASRAANDRIRVGFYSSDFRTHPVSAVAVDLFERLDRSRFETFAFSFSNRPGDPLRPRIEAAFDRFIDVQAMKDAQVAGLSRELGIDIAIDLMGFTAGNRTGIFASRAAPVQAGYLGYPGTMAAPYIDYIVADRTVIPEAFQHEYTERIVSLPESYMPSDGKRALAQEPPSREAMGLPPAGFVFCSFNNTYKITPEVFAAWMRILAKVPGSVLWLMHDSALPAENLRRRAGSAGVDPRRLVFASRMPLPQDHLARHRLADLFLDTLPFNAHTTASDALWSGLPVLTRCGEAFAGRVAASLLHAIGLPELVTHTLGDYEARAIELAQDPRMLASLRRKLVANRLVAPLFDSARFARHMEAALQAMHDRQRAGLAPDHIDVPRHTTPAPLMPAQLMEQARAWHKEGRLRDALAGYEQVKQAQPDHFEAWHLSGIIQAAMGDMSGSAESIARAIELRPGDPAAHNNLGNAFHALSRHDAAIAAYRRAIEFDDNATDARNNLSNTLHDTRRFAEALAGYEEVVRRRPDWATAWLRRGNTLASLGRFALALDSFRKAQALMAVEGKGNASALALLHGNCGNSQTALGLHEAAMESYEQALALQPDDAQAHWNKALLLLQMGELEEGWREFEWRWKHESLNLRKRPFSQPRWTGQERVQGKTLLLHCEQGFGDSIQFCRYARLVTDLGARVVLETPAALMKLFTTLQPLPELVAQGSPLPAFDMHCPLMSLPMAFDTRLDNVPAPRRYLAGEPAATRRWAERLSGGKGRRVGLAWSGRPTHANDGNRSIAFSDIRDLLPPGLDYICLQKELRDADAAAMQQDGRVRSFAAQLHDFSDTAALCENLDLVITVDTSVAHLAGALGKPVWILLPFNADWRWMRERCHSPWYPTARLFRQAEPGSWVPTLDSLRAALVAWRDDTQR